MNRRSIFKLFAGVVMASAMEVCGMRAVSMRRHSDSICLLDVRSSFNFKRRLESVISGLVDLLPEDGKFLLQWVNVYDKQCNPFHSVGYFLAIPQEDNAENRITVDENGFINDLLRMT